MVCLITPCILVLHTRHCDTWCDAAAQWPQESKGFNPTGPSEQSELLDQLIRQAKLATRANLTRQAKLTTRAKLTRQAQLTKQATLTRRSKLTKPATLTKQAKLIKLAKLTRQATLPN